MHIIGLVHQKRKIHLDGRGRFEELFRHSKFDQEYQIPFVSRQVSLSVSEKNVVRGMHCSSYHKMVNVVSGIIWDVALDLRPDSPSFGQMYHTTLDSSNGDVLIFPPGVAHGFCALTDNATVIYVQAGELGPGTEIEFNALDPKVNIPWPIPQEAMIMSTKDRGNTMFEQVETRLAEWVLNIPRPCDVILIGSNGYIGSWFLRVLKEMKLRVYVTNERLDQRQQLQALISYCMPQNVIVCAGVAGKPNIDWCKDHPSETIDANISNQLGMVEICRRLNIHVTLILSGGIYNSENGQFFSEMDVPNHTQHPYTQFRHIEEQLLQALDQLPVLGLRIHYPISSDGHARSLLSKLLQFSTVYDTTTSLSVLDDIVPLAVHMSLAKKTGIYNATNPGSITYSSLLRDYQKLCPSVTLPEIVSQGQAMRPGCQLDSRKLVHVAHELDVPLQPVEQALSQMLCKLVGSD
jgi:3,5-epimerase/4-reductase